MKTISLTEIPNYIQNSILYKELKSSDMDYISTLKYSYFNVDIKSISELDELLDTFNFWGVISVPESIYDKVIGFANNNKDATLKVLNKHKMYVPFVNYFKMLVDFQNTCYEELLNEKIDDIKSLDYYKDKYIIREAVNGDDLTFLKYAFTNYKFNKGAINVLANRRWYDAINHLITNFDKYKENSLCYYKKYLCDYIVLKEICKNNDLEYLKYIYQLCSFDLNKSERIIYDDRYCGSYSYRNTNYDYFKEYIDRSVDNIDSVKYLTKMEFFDRKNSYEYCNKSLECFNFVFNDYKYEITNVKINGIYYRDRLFEIIEDAIDYIATHDFVEALKIVIKFILSKKSNAFDFFWEYGDDNNVLRHAILTVLSSNNATKCIKYFLDTVKYINTDIINSFSQKNTFETFKMLYDKLDFKYSNSEEPLDDGDDSDMPAQEYFELEKIRINTIIPSSFKVYFRGHNIEIMIFVLKKFKMTPDKIIETMFNQKIDYHQPKSLITLDGLKFVIEKFRDIIDFNSLMAGLTQFGNLDCVEYLHKYIQNNNLLLNKDVLTDVFNARSYSSLINNYSALKCIKLIHNNYEQNLSNDVMFKAYDIHNYMLLKYLHDIGCSVNVEMFEKMLKETDLRTDSYVYRSQITLQMWIELMIVRGLNVNQAFKTYCDNIINSLSIFSPKEIFEQIDMFIEHVNIKDSEEFVIELMKLFKGKLNDKAKEYLVLLFKKGFIMEEKLFDMIINNDWLEYFHENVKDAKYLFNKLENIDSILVNKDCKIIKFIHENICDLTDTLQSDFLEKKIFEMLNNYILRNGYFNSSSTYERNIKYNKRPYIYLNYYDFESIEFLKLLGFKLSDNFINELVKYHTFGLLHLINEHNSGTVPNSALEIANKIINYDQPRFHCEYDGEHYNFYEEEIIKLKDQRNYILENITMKRNYSEETNSDTEVNFFSDESNQLVSSLHDDVW